MDYTCNKESACSTLGPKQGIAQNPLVARDALQLAIDDDSFAFVVEARALHAIAAAIAAAKEMMRAALKGSSGLRQQQHRAAHGCIKATGPMGSALVIESRDDS